MKKTGLSALLTLLLVLMAPASFAAKVPPGFKIELFAEEVPGARQMALSDAGIVYTGSRRDGKVHAVVDKDKDFKADEVVLVAEGLYMPSGLAYKDGDLYVAEVNKILRFKDIDSNYRKQPEPEVIFDQLPSESHHGWKYIKFGPDGHLYIPIGVPCNICLEEDPRFGTIGRLNIESGEFELVATGVRNSVGFDWHPQSGQLWFTDNGRDWMGDELPPCELNQLTEDGQFFGFPYVHGKDVLDPEWGEKLGERAFQPPAWEFTAHVAPLGMLFYTGNMFPPEYRQTIFVALHGSWNRSNKVGYKVVNLKLKDGKVVEQQDFVTGWLKGEEVLGRPNDVIMLSDGSLLISDDGFSKIYRVSYQQSE